ncbi:hypothetical protein L1987_53540 [Smallanthus sonchifolius]|uniref:Uncharacterized protein n=1 Tax=Smallanthus sonchifolius TaxID=185202 RepID=A0ACB9EWJ8_9ASTR|nr:hypothetical protein L1987_53540 [Smallanthus sonchifolius]
MGLPGSRWKVKAGEKTTQDLVPRDEVIGIAVALVALIKSKEPGSQIDLELLPQLLCNPGTHLKYTDTVCFILSKNSDGRKGVQGAQLDPMLDWMQKVRIVVDAAKGLDRVGLG